MGRRHAKASATVGLGLDAMALARLSGETGDTGCAQRWGESPCRTTRFPKSAAPCLPGRGLLQLDNAENRRIGIGLVTLTTLCFAVLDTSAKWRVQALRAAMMAAMTALNFWALQYLQLAETGAIQFSVPLLIALFSAWWLGERLDARRWLAIVAGFAGVLLVIRPGSQAFHPGILLSVMNALLYAAFNMLTRRMVATESAASLQLMPAAGAAVVVMSGLYLLWLEIKQRCGPESRIGAHGKPGGCHGTRP